MEQEKNEIREREREEQKGAKKIHEDEILSSVLERLQVGAVNSVSIDGGIKANDLHKITCLWIVRRKEGRRGKKRERKMRKERKRRKKKNKKGMERED